MIKKRSNLPLLISQYIKNVAKAILKAAKSSRLEIIVPAVVRGAVWTKQTFPYLINPLIGSTFRKYLDSEKKTN